MRRAVVVPLALAVAVGPILGPILGSPALAQEETVVGGPLFSATVSQSFELDTNLDLADPRPGTSYFTDSRLALSLLNETPTQVFALDLDTGVRALWQADEDFEFTFASPTTATAAFAQEWASGMVDSQFRFRQTRVDFDRPLDDFLDPDLGVPLLPDDPDQREDDTTQRRYDANVDLELATDAPSSYAFGLAASRIDYSDVSLDLIPRDTVAADATWSLQLTPLVASALSARYFYYIADNPEETEIRETEVDAGLIYSPNERLQVGAGLGYVVREQEEFGETVEDDSGIAVRGTLRYDFDEFVVNGSVRVTTAAPETRLSGDLRFVYPLINSWVTGRIFQDYTGGSAGDEIRITGAGLGLLREINTDSRVAFDFAASRRANQDDPDDPDVDRLEFTSTYSHDFTDVVTGDIGYRFSSLEEDPDSAVGHAVFVEISRSFQTRP